MEIIAHRDASYDAPENTLVAFTLGWQQGADAVELDVHQTKDGKIAILHDPDTKRVSGRDFKVAQATLAELRKLDLGSWKNKIWAGERMLALETAFSLMPMGKRLFVEIKCGPEILPMVENSLRVSGRKTGEMVIIGFSLETMRQAKIKFPECQVYWLSSFKKDKTSGAWTPSADDLVKQAVEAKLDGLDLKAETEVLDAAFAKKVKAAGLKFHVWTVDDPVVAKKMVEIGVDGITTNRPEWLRQQLK